MNRIYTQFRYSLEKKVIEIFGKVTIGASGAPTLSASESKGVASIARNSAGKYTITLQDKYVKLLGFEASVEKSSGSPGAVYGPVLRSEAVSSGKTVVVEFLGPTASGDTSAVATELASGCVVRFKIVLSGTTA